MNKNTKKEERLIEVCRSFSYKMSMPKYENRDFFCSQKCECTEEEAEAKSEALYLFCKKEVEKSVALYLRDLEIEKKLAREAAIKAEEERLAAIVEDGGKLWDEKKQEIYNREAEIQNEAGRLCQHTD